MTGKREIVFDTETTGFDARGEDRITEIGCIEIIDFLPTGKSFHSYCDPKRDVPEKVTEITGLTTEFLRGKPLFKEVAPKFLEFIGDSPLIAHNADFDRGFINAELKRADFKEIPQSRFIDTLAIAREMFPGSPASLDALCKKFQISLASRDTHGAIIDSQLLARVYLELNGGRARKLDLTDMDQGDRHGVLISKARPRPVPLKPLCTDAEREAHRAFVNSLGDNMIWHKVWRRQAKGN